MQEEDFCIDSEVYYEGAHPLYYALSQVNLIQLTWHTNHIGRMTSSGNCQHF